MHNECMYIMYVVYIPLVVAELWKSKYSSTFFSSDIVDLNNFNCDNSSPYTATRHTSYIAT